MPLTPAERTVPSGRATRPCVHRPDLLDRRAVGDRGAATTELVIVMPLLLLLVFATIHVGLWFHARQIVAAAADEGARAARARNPSIPAAETAGRKHANDMLDQLGRGSFTGTPVVVVVVNANDVTVTVTGESQSIVFGLAVQVSASTTSPVERFR